MINTARARSFLSNREIQVLHMENPFLSLVHKFTANSIVKVIFDQISMLPFNSYMVKLVIQDA